MNQAATEVMLTLGLADRMAGTAYLDDDVLPELAADYAKVPVLAKEYPSREALLKAESDFVYASYPSAFEADAAGSREELARLGVVSYLSPAACADRDDADPLTLEDVWDEILEVGTVFGVRDRAEQVVAAQRATVEKARAGLRSADPLRALWWDGGTDAPSAGACCGAPGMVMAALGVTNVFGSLPGGWADASWEAVVKAGPDVIVLVDASWDTAASKRAFLESDPVTRELRAVAEGRLVTVPFSATTPGVRNADAVAELSASLAALPSE
nr:ABC transporter substrate-binding protein [Motilibacter aurantiacus]